MSSILGYLVSRVSLTKAWTRLLHTLCRCIHICTGSYTTVRILALEHIHLLIFSVKDASVVMCTSDCKGPRGGSASSELYSFALTDAAPFYMILCCSATYMNLLTGTSELGEPDRYKLEAIHLVNLRLQNPKEAVSDAVITAVTYLAIIEVSAIVPQLDTSSEFWPSASLQIIQHGHSI